MHNYLHVIIEVYQLIIFINVEIAKKLKETSADEKKKQENNKQTIRDLMIYAGWEAPVSHFWIMSGMSFSGNCQGP